MPAGPAQVSTFFINYIMLQALASVPMDLLRIVPLIITKLKLRYLAKTRREIGETIAGGSGACRVRAGRQLLRYHPTD